MNHFNEYKKSILTSIGFLFLTACALAQDTTRLTLLLQEKDYARAKELADSQVSSKPADYMVWLQKSEVYIAISKDADARNLVADAKMEAFNALKKAAQLDASAVKLRLQTNNYSLPQQLYDGYTNDGLMLYNAAVERNDKDQYNNALVNFKQAGTISRFIFDHQWGYSALDTLNLYYTSKSAINADKEEDAIFYSKKIIDNNITFCYTQNGFESVYQWLVYHYKTKQDAANFNTYTASGAKAFPASGYFLLSYIDWYRQQKDYVKLFEQYQQLFKAGDANSKYQLIYYQDVFNYLYEPNPANADKQTYKSILDKGLSEFIKLNPENTAGRLLLAKFYINQAVEKMKTIATVKNQKTIAELKRSAHSNYKIANQNLLQIVNRLAKKSMSNYNEALQLLINNYKVLNQPKEVRKYQALLGKSIAILYKVLILIILLLNIILIIRNLVPSFYSSVIFFSENVRAVFIAIFAEYSYSLTSKIAIKTAIATLSLTFL